MASTPATTVSASGIDRLTSGNYAVWKFRVRMLLTGSDLWQAVEIAKDTVVDPVTDRKALAVIINAAGDDQLTHLTDVNTAHDAWKRLQDIHEQKNNASRMFILRKLLTLRMAPTETITEFLGRAKAMREQLQAADITLNNEIIIAILLAGLPDSYDSLVIALETLSDKLTYDFVVSRLLHEETRRSEDHHFTPDNFDAVLLGHATATNTAPSRCTYCAKKGHPYRECHKRIGDEAVADYKRRTEHAHIAATGYTTHNHHLF